MHLGSSYKYDERCSHADRGGSHKGCTERISGASINGGFLKEDMIDEFSVVVLPYVDGNRQHKALVDTDGAFCGPHEIYKRTIRRRDCG